MTKKNKTNRLTRETINPESYYTPTELYDNGIFPWIKSIITLREVVNSPRGIELLKPIVKVTRRYHIRGENVIKLLKLADAGELEL